MPSKRKSAGDLSDDHVYAKPPAPKRQARLTAPKKRITYGTKKTPKLSRQTLNREHHQTTVTQIWKEDFTESGEPTGVDGLESKEENALEDASIQQHVLLVEEGLEEILLPDNEQALAESGQYGAKSRAKKSKAKSKRNPSKPATERKNVRKSTGSIPKSEIVRRPTRRRTEGDMSSEGTDLHQQTMTQWHRSFASTSDSDIEIEHIPDIKSHTGKEEEQNLEKSIYDVPSSSQSIHLPSNVPQLSRLERPRGTTPQQNTGPYSEMGPPRTPHRVQTQEIPSSQSPATPLSLPSRGSTRKRHPLKERTTNTPSPLHAHERLHMSPKKLPKMEIEDTFDTETNVSQLTRIPTTPLKRSSPAKSVRFALREEDSEVETFRTPTKHPIRPVRLSRESMPTPKLEILDSDAESDDEKFDLSECKLGAENKLERGSNPQSLVIEEEQEQESQELINYQELEEPETYYGGFGEDTQIEAEKLVVISNSEQEHDEEESHDESKAEEKTQMMESQRLSFHYRKTMAPITAESDVFISLHPSKVTDIINRTRDHEMRNWRLPPPVCRLWIYETAPVKAVKYMAEIGPLKLPGQIADERGLENANFNTRRATSSWVAYEILQVYELSDPQSWTELKAKGWLNQPPTKFSKVPPAVTGELIHNLRCPLFISDVDVDEPSSSLTDTQEAEAQLLSTMKQFTQPDTPSRFFRSQAGVTQQEKHSSPVHGSSPVLSANGNNPIPSQATTVDLSQTQTPRHQSLVDVVCESPTRPVHSSSVKMPLSATGNSKHHEHESLSPFTLPSSQLMSKSQMLPDSLLDDSLAIPAPLVRDSDDEDDD